MEEIERLKRILNSKNASPAAKVYALKDLTSMQKSFKKKYVT